MRGWQPGVGVCVEEDEGASVDGVEYVYPSCRRPVIEGCREPGGVVGVVGVDSVNVVVLVVEEFGDFGVKEGGHEEVGGM